MRKSTLYTFGFFVTLTLATWAPAQENCRLLWNAEGARNTAQAHDAITHDLFTGEITSVRPFSQDSNNHGLYIATIKGTDPYTGQARYREAFFKPRVMGDEDGWSRTPMEYLAYFLNRQLGMDYVPPVAYRRGLNLRIGDQTYSEGALMLKAPDFQSLHSLPRAHYAEDHAAITSDHRVLNVLLQNQDGHSKNLGQGKHWVDGQTHPVFIDFGASMRRGTNVTMDHYPAFENSEAVKQIRRVTYDKLKTLNKDMFKDVVRSDLMTQREVDKLLARRDQILSYFDYRVSKYGADNVFLP